MGRTHDARRAHRDISSASRAFTLQYTSIPKSSSVHVQTLTVSLACAALKLDQPGVGALTYSDEERKVMSCSKARLVVSEPRGRGLSSLTCHLRALLASFAQMLAKDSLRWKCPVCAAEMAGILPDAPRGSGADAPADRCLPATPPAPATAEATAASPTASDPLAPTAPSPAAVASTPAPALAAAVPAAAASVAVTAATSTSQPAPSAAPAQSATATAPAPAAAAALGQAVAQQTDWSLYFIYGLVVAIVALFVKKLYK